MSLPINMSSLLHGHAVEWERLEFKAGWVVVSYPGPDRSIRLANLQAGRAVSRRYRNRRIGEFLKELDLTEGRSTGIPKMLRVLRENGSPDPLFETDDDRAALVLRLPVHPEALQPESGPSQARVGAEPGQSRQTTDKILERPESGPSRQSVDALSTSDEPPERLESRLKSRLESGLAAKLLLVLNNAEAGKAALASSLGHKTVSGELKKQITRLLSEELIEMTRPETPNSRLQRYRLTGKGRAWLAGE